MRVEVYTGKGHTDGRAAALLQSLQSHLQCEIRNLAVIDVYLLEHVAISAAEAGEVFSDPVTQRTAVDSPACMTAPMPDWTFLVEVAARAGVTDPVALTAREALKLALGHGPGPHSVVQTARQYLFSAPDLVEEQRRKITAYLHNPLIQRAVTMSREEWSRGARLPAVYPHTVEPSPMRVEAFAIDSMDDAALTELSRRRLLALSLEEMRTLRREWSQTEIRAARRGRGLTEEITDVELEMIAQTWSEHCKHKIFNAVIDYNEERPGGPREGEGEPGRSDGAKGRPEGDTGVRRERIDSFFDTYIRSTTEELSRRKRYLRSVFHDNSGVVAVDRRTLVCFKVETHNSPSALDPYGGAITGIVGVNRDIIGTGKGAKPIFNTNVLCFGPPDMPAEDVPEGLLSPRRVMEGVHRGIIDGGNQSGIPVVGGAFLFDESFLGKPLVFCGTGGILPAKIRGEPGEAAAPRPGDYAVMVGGRIGKDGIHGATFSSQALDETSPTSAVQIGDPITQKKMLDFLLEARDRGLYRGITDNGAGGLSSSLGEMARESGGVRIELDRCPLKYSGLAPWEILVSESQERMSLSVPPESWPALSELAASREVEATLVGRFTDSGAVEISYRGELVGLLGCGFLHEGLPRMELRAVWKPPAAAPGAVPAHGNPRAELLGLLADPNIASKEELVRQYDHEVQARSVIKPFVGVRADGPSDGAVLRIGLGGRRGITVTHGICPRFGDFDTYRMAMCAVDEAFRAHVACGGDPDRAAALDNFCWPDPVAGPDNPDGEHKLAQLVRAGKGLKRACLAYGLPLISGKDSMKNDAVMDGKKVSIRPTLLISLVGVVPDVRRAMSPDLKTPGDLLFVLGETLAQLGGSAFERLVGRNLGPCPLPEPENVMPLYRALHRVIRRGWINACHDVAEGGLAVAVCEAALAGRLGADVDAGLLASPGLAPQRVLFSETPSRFIVSCAPENERRLMRSFRRLPIQPVGKVTDDARVRLRRDGETVVELSLEEIETAWKTRI